MSDTSTPPAIDAPMLDWARYYLSFGWALSQFPPGTKGPRGKGWNTPTRWIDTPAKADAAWTAYPTHGVGVIHAGSGTVALDVDHVVHTRAIFAEFGLDLEALLAGAPRIRGKQAGRDKALFRAPAGESLKMHKAEWQHPTDPAQSVTLFELRAGPVHDCLPPSPHPDGHRYAWLTSPEALATMPELPAALLGFWREFPTLKPQIAAMAPWATSPAVPAAPRGQTEAHSDVIGAFNRAHRVEALLEAHGYERRGRRWLAPSSSSQIPGVALLGDGRVFSHHGSDPLADGHAHDAFDLFRLLDHGGDQAAAVRGAAAILGLPSGLQERGQRARRSDARPDQPAPAAPLPSSTEPVSAHVGTAKVTTLADVAIEPVEWLWPGRIPLGKLSLIEGMPGVGKSQLTMMLAAAVSRGFALPGGTAAAPAHVLLLTAEDGLGDTVRPRLEAAGGDPTRVHVVEGIVEEDGPCRFPGLPDDLLPIAAEIRGRAVKLVIVDPLTAYLGSAVNSWRDADVRRALAPLAALAQATGAAVVVIRHLNKAPSGQAITAGGGSIGIIGAARTALLVAKDPNDDGRRVLACVKNNLSRMPASLAFRLEAQASGWSAVVFEGESSHTADSLIAAGRDTEDRTQRDEARDFLLDALRDGPVLVKEIQRQAKGAGIADATLRRARETLGVKANKGGWETGWTWELLAEVSAVEDEGAPKAPEDAQAPYNPAHVSIFEGSTGPNALSRNNLIEDAHGEHLPVSTFERQTPNGLPRCSVCGGPLLRRRSGVTRCPACIGSSARDPYVEPLPAGNPAA